MDKKQYMKPAMRMVNTRPHRIICTSPNDYDRRTLRMYGGSDNATINEEEDIW